MTGALIFVAVMMVAGIYLRQRFALFRLLFIPASVIAGGIGLLVVQLLLSWGAAVVDPEVAVEAPGGLPDSAPFWVAWASDLTEQLGSWPGWLIAVVFAGLLLERRGDGGGGAARRTLSQAIMVWIIVLGQTALGLTMVWLVIQPFLADVPNSFGMLIETGFAGGHGTAGAMGEVFAHPSIRLEGGLDLGVLMATVGLVYGVVSGIGWINLAARLGWIQRADGSLDAVASESNPTAAARRPVAFERIDRDLVDPLLLQMLWLALAFGVGWGLHSGVGQLAARLDASQNANQPITASADAIVADAGSPATTTPEGGEEQSAAEAQLGQRLTWSAILGGFPLFIYTLVGGWVIRTVLVRCGQGSLIDADLLKSLSAVAMDVLVVAAITALNLNAVVRNLAPLSVLLVAAFLWTGCCLMLLSRRILPPEHWFPLGLINYGMSTGTTATGFVLLRVVDPQLKTQAAEDYALAAPLSAPFVGGGILTVGLPLLVLERVPIGVSSLVLVAIVTGLILVGVRLQPRSA